MAQLRLRLRAIVERWDALREANAMTKQLACEVSDELRSRFHYRGGAAGADLAPLLPKLRRAFLQAAREKEEPGTWEALWRRLGQRMASSFSWRGDASLLAQYTLAETTWQQRLSTAVATLASPGHHLSADEGTAFMDASLLDTPILTAGNRGERI